MLKDQGRQPVLTLALYSTGPPTTVIWPHSSSAVMLLTLAYANGTSQHLRASNFNHQQSIMKTFSIFVVATCWLFVALAHGHTVLSYPGWRGNTFITNETYPFGMQWTYPCGGLGVTQNRTHWPISGGALAVQPGWNSGHKTALMYINLGLGESPKNYSMVMVPRFQLTGPSNQEYEGTFCLPKVPLPAGVTPKEGDLASIQVVEAAQHGAALFSVRCLTKCYRLPKYFMPRGSAQHYWDGKCVDIIFTEDASKVTPVTADNCFNSTNLKVEAATLETNSSPITDPSAPATTTTTTPSASPTSGAPRRWFLTYTYVVE
ncbi:uncharacterized protein CLUP02_17809 [Colletotrichum lupini]|uniref:Copper acquisition factor BIM1-like domain-containing protein n=1 Tax=Colletotrichum lupini TaxID=145971 RepID=A0A9Q8WAQ3_9PEZI|nr:uncharacterized protein CLUP02_17809 [Colletotrichum lupini]UQC76296.1 hypothetical protein CLUP02_17809 [Colletotrichum lupini]